MGAGALFDVLERARGWGFLGPGPIEPHIAHARRFAGAVARRARPGRVLDLGGGSGIPGLVLALHDWTDARWVLLDSSARRCAFLTAAIETLGVSDRAVVAEGRAEDVARSGGMRGTQDVVVSRSFGAPAVAAECGAPFLRLGGALIVSEPPVPVPERWPAAGLAMLGLQRIESGDTGMAVFEQVSRCPSTYPRAVGVPSKRPLFTR